MLHNNSSVLKRLGSINIKFNDRTINGGAEPWLGRRIDASTGSDLNVTALIDDKSSLLSTMKSYIPNVVNVETSTLIFVGISIVALIIAFIVYKYFISGKATIENGRILNGLVTSKSITRCATYEGNHIDFSTRFWFKVNHFDTSYANRSSKNEMRKNILTILGGDLERGQKTIGVIKGAERVMLPCFDNYITESNKIFTVSLVGDGTSNGCKLVAMYNGMNNERLTVEYKVDLDNEAEQNEGWHFAYIKVINTSGVPSIEMRIDTLDWQISRGTFTDNVPQNMEIIILGVYDEIPECHMMDYDFTNLRMNNGVIDESLIAVELLSRNKHLDKQLVDSTSCSAEFRS